LGERRFGLRWPVVDHIFGMLTNMFLTRALLN
jgi:hypothetical protein